ncbi:site-specific integrase [Pelobacter propionicus]|uniref:Tyr recombinase domain-containing protein n=1 Tax=Pelobacter propionicus (strain DSM 2379 / NBRC 103807 / OttBd1) TaxID=338966 RepID=A1ANN3_PELPD|nr:site-specific integrase [Pelobacter propionicus]ABK98953.1 hypothetical protein Ppro_1333 [Pelobacter propionicus DSM 2379]
MSKHLFTRNGRYYFRQWFPLDLRPLFGNKTDIAKSLKTSNKKEALALAGGLQQKFSVAFTLIRTGLLSPEMLDGLMAYTLPCKHHKPAPPHSPVVSPTSQRASVKLSKLIDMYTKEHSPNWTPKSQHEIDRQLELLMMVLDNKPVCDIDRASCVSCRDILRRLPPGFMRINRFKNLTVPELLKVNTGNEGMHLATVNKYMILLSSLLKWGAKHGHTDSNPAEGLTLGKDTRTDEERKAYSNDDLRKVLDHCSVQVKPYRRWVPLIAMYSGMRLEEICQLSTEDIRTIDGIVCFDVNTQGDKRLKSKSSKRIVPVHPDLISMGLLVYLEQKRGASPAGCNLWGLSKGRWGYGKNVGNWYGNSFNRQYITDDPLKCFHSFRHS